MLLHRAREPHQLNDLTGAVEAAWLESGDGGEREIGREEGYDEEEQEEEEEEEEQQLGFYVAENEKEEGGRRGQRDEKEEEDDGDNEDEEEKNEAEKAEQEQEEEEEEEETRMTTLINSESRSLETDRAPNMDQLDDRGSKSQYVAISLLFCVALSAAVTPAGSPLLQELLAVLLDEMK
ncbi:hypothetical protein O3P69_008216 [Scylla paramamosain]|uniref:Uncharacterized protein n=1 Tax=Scylla paramamosain TaxID=85552 RepID=A0AAW0T0V4_SCYPA